MMMMVVGVPEGDDIDDDGDEQVRPELDTLDSR